MTKENQDHIRKTLEFDLKGLNKQINTNKMHI